MPSELRSLANSSAQRLRGHQRHRNTEPLRHGVGIVRLHQAERASRWRQVRQPPMTDGAGREGRRVDRRHPQADLVQVVDEVFEAHIVVGVVVEDQFLPIPKRRAS